MLWRVIGNYAAPDKMERQSKPIPCAFYLKISLVQTQYIFVLLYVTSRELMPPFLQLW